MTNEMLRHRYAVNNAGSDMWGLKFSEIHEEDLKNGNILFNFIHSPALEFLHTIRIRQSSKMGFVIGHKKTIMGKGIWEACGKY